MRRRDLLGFLWWMMIPCMAAAHSDRPLDQALIDASGRGDVTETRRLLGAGASVRARGPSGLSALLAAARGNHVEVARLLIAAGADVNAQDDSRDSAYLVAGAQGHLEILRLTLVAGADLKSTNRYGGTALIPAAHHGHVEVVREMLTTAIDIDHVNNLGWTALLEAVILGDGGPRHAEIVRLLVAAGANLNLADRSGITPLQHARRMRQDDVVRILTEAGAR